MPKLPVSPAALGGPSLGNGAVTVAAVPRLRQQCRGCANNAVAYINSATAVPAMPWLHQCCHSRANDTMAIPTMPQPCQ